MRRDLEAFSGRTFDLCIIGGGITGAGAALDAASRGWSVALIEKGDFASGTSSASSKLIHGGLRYLEFGQLPLVYEALHERAFLLRNAPHLVAPLPFVLPFYRGQRLAPWQWRLGLTLYDLLAGRSNIHRSRPLSTAQVRTQSPALNPTALIGGALYHDALMDDARLCFAVLQTAADFSAVVANYIEATGFEKQAGAICGVEAKDQVSDAGLSIRCRAVLNAAGPWADELGKLAGESAGPYLQPTKGVHLIAPPRGHRSAFLLLHPRDGRVFFVIPWMGKTLIGTTDTLPDGDPDHLQVQPQEIVYLLDGYNHYFDLPLAAADVMGTFVGLRPLIRASPREPSSRSREFRLVRSPFGMWTALGGKYTTFRRMAEIIIDQIGAALGKRQPCCTADIRLHGAPAERWPSFRDRTVASIQQRYPVAADSALHLVRSYGTRVNEVLQTMATVPHGFDRVHPDEPDLIGEIRWQRDEEMAVLPGDFHLRRSRIGMFRPEVLTPMPDSPAQP